MLRGAFEGWHIVLILGVVVVLFGSRKLPDAARSVGQSLRIFKSEMKAAAQDDRPAQSTAAPVAPQAVEGRVVNQPTAQPADAVPQSTTTPQA
ncbi:MAG TPA: Sec-independent protein translocase subunit TatA [Actinocrinis sp.]|jgi:sec-independent protein translocase protein TatA|uniref:Sec-independent protein translocase subunit TatA n=1 Tax=Actinocrinis sp. TaxID=1920516 RepID=UPI002DDCEE9C|nr:Sec-independent protein translocase subunit TatA [Actinocrinis sp.]HEV3169030.1 Sec-independent protein translocase subunit TatA [Actinocrinis sp.]